jgi:hypothetical protein
MARESIPSLGVAPSEADRARWARLAVDFEKLPLVPSSDGASREEASSEEGHRDVGELLLLGHDDALAEAERYVILGHTIRTGDVVEYDDIDDEISLARWVHELERASAAGWAPAVPKGFWASFLRWRTPLGMARLTDRRLRVARPVREAV